ncbi:MAG TPA: DUF2007 domain-containing protein [Xanthomonadaceae bacterium]|jgi:hypothetical protein|nr:DUF2007 domain-containing protein [Xanthomonadaceae bacterium]
MRTVYRADSLLDAHVAKGLLESEGIACHVSGGYLAGGIGELPPLGVVQVLVADHDEARAHDVLAVLQEGPGDGVFEA